jgi:DUF4097 and DUF4098 domain-containing protein YvlB
VTGKIKGRTSGGSISVANSSIDIDLSTSGGGIDARNCKGNITLFTSGGSVDLDNLNGIVEVETSGGTIKGRSIAGELRAHTSGGTIRLDDLTCTLDASTSGGGINVAIKEFGKYIKVSNSGGNIDLQIPGQKGVDLDLSGDKIKTDALSNFSGKMEDDRIVGKLNGGGVSVNARSNGRVSLVIR